MVLDTTRHNISRNIQKQEVELYSHYDHDRIKGPCQPSREYVLLCLFMAERLPKAPSTDAERGLHREVLCGGLSRATLPKKFLYNLTLQGVLCSRAPGKVSVTLGNGRWDSALCCTQEARAALPARVQICLEIISH